MPLIYTLGGPKKRTQFNYTGDVLTGVTIEFTGKPRIAHSFFQSILNQFRGSTIQGGFSMTNPSKAGLGYWVANNSKRLNHLSLTPRHASFISAILVHEGYIRSSLKGNSVILHF
jgi:hypothetical protein